MENVLHQKIRMKDGFGVSKVATSIQDKKEDKENGKLPKIEDVELQTKRLEENDSQIQKTTRRAIGR